MPLAATLLAKLPKDQMSALAYRFNIKDRGDQRDKESYSICGMPMIGTGEKREREFNKVKRSVESLGQRRSKHRKDEGDIIDRPAETIKQN